jgi:hypothetical protein
VPWKIEVLSKIGEELKDDEGLNILVFCTVAELEYLEDWTKREEDRKARVCPNLPDCVRKRETGHRRLELNTLDNEKSSDVSKVLDSEKMLVDTKVLLRGSVGSGLGDFVFVGIGEALRLSVETYKLQLTP